MAKNYFLRLYSVRRLNCRTTHSRLWNTIIMSVFLCFTIIALGTLKPAVAQETGDSTPPLIVLHHGIGNFFVLASDIPFKVRQAEPKVSWMEVEAVEGNQTAHRTVTIKSHPENLSQANYYSAIRVDLLTSQGEDYLLIPVALKVGKEFERKFERDPLLEADVPGAYIRLQPDDPNIDVRFVMTPGGHYIFEIIDRDKENTKRQLRPESVQSKQTQIISSLTAGTSAADAPSQTYEIVFPWMCLEYPCGRSTSDDIADVEPNLDAVNSVSYERYTMSAGWWGIYDVGDPGPWAGQADLRTWPMVTGGYNPSGSDIQAMWDNRMTIANHMIAEALENGYQGYCIDVEGHADAATKNTFVNLMDYYADELHAHGFQIMVVHATWSTIAPIEDLSETSVDYVATMDPYTSLWYDYIPADYHAIEHDRLIWGFTWDRVSADTQQEMWQWMQQGGYNVGVAGAAAWRTPLMPPHPGNDVDYYQGFRNYYPPADFEEELPAGDNVALGAIGWEASSSFSADYGGDKAYDGAISGTSKWTSDGSGAESWLALDLGKDYDVTGFIVRHSGAAGEWSSFNIAAYRLESGSSLSGPWTVLTEVDNSAQQNTTTTVLESIVRTRYVRLFITDAGVDNYARIPEFEVYGTLPPDEGIPSITGGEPKGTFGSGEQSDEETEPGTWRWSERFYGHQGIDQITWRADGCGVQHNYVIGLDQNDLIEYLMKFGGDYSRLILRGLADRPGPVEIEIYIDGNYAATAEWDNDNDCNQDVVVEIPGIPYGTHAIAVKFVNDYYDPSNGMDRNFYLDGLLVAESETPDIPSITGGEPKGPFGSGEQSDEETEPETWRWSERFYGHQGIDQITSQADGCGVQHTYAMGWHQNDLIEYLMKFGGDYSRLTLRGLADRPGPVTLEIYIDGSYAATAEWDDDNDCNQDVAVEIPDIPYGTHAIAIKFVNDYYDPGTGMDRNFYLDGLLVTESQSSDIPSITGGEPKGTFGSGAQSDEETEPETWRWSERFYGHQGIDQITWQADGCGVQHNYVIGLDQNDLIEYLMKFGGQYPWLILRGIADRPGPVEFDVYIDGQYAASGAWESNSDCNQEVGVEIPGIPYGTHAIAVQFTNDYYNPASGEDRNFYLDGLKVASQWDQAAISWAYPVGTADTAEGWYVSNPLGNSWYSSTNQRWFRGHLGEDWFKSVGSSYGEAVYASADGKVITVLNNCGNYVDVVIIEHQMPGFSEPIYSFYGHLEANGYVSEGDWVARRQQIGVLGDPVDFYPHLHFEIKNRTALVNPPFSSCSDIPNETYIGAGYSGISDDYDGGDYYDPSDGIFGNRHYHPTRFIENRK